MIDAHCHLEWKSFDSDRDEIIEKCKKAGLKAIVTSCARLADIDKTFGIVEKHAGYVFATFGLHPEFIQKIKSTDVDAFFEKIRENKDKVVAIGEVGLDYNWVKELSWREKQKELFAQMIEFAKDLKKPLVVHCRDAYEEALKILEQHDAKNVLMHMFGDKNLLARVVENGYFVSMNAVVLKSKAHRKIARDIPLEKLMLETDAPWLHPERRKRNDPRTIKIVAEKIAEIRKVGFEQVWKQCAKNVVGFFGLPVKI